MSRRSIRFWAAAYFLVACVAATHRTPNFVVEAPTAQITQQISAYAEHYRRELARAWLGKQLPNWYQPCSLKVKVGNVGAGGSTTFSFDRGEVFGWRMVVQGQLDRILVSVLPHEVNHTIFASHFRRPLPRWYDEGAATVLEDCEEHARQRTMLKARIQDSRIYSIRKLLSAREYPRDVLALYAQGFSLCEFLIAEHGKEAFLSYPDIAGPSGIDAGIQQAFGYESAEAMEVTWAVWFREHYGTDQACYRPVDT